MNAPFMDDQPSTPTASGSREKAMGFWDHITELRGTIIKSVIVFVFFTALIAYYLPRFNHLVMWPFDSVRAQFPHLDITLGTGGMTEGFNMLVQISMLGGLILSAPFILFFIGQFVAPALTAKERTAVLPLCAGSLALFLTGAAFAFFILAPSAVRVFIEINEAYGWTFLWTVGDYYGILTHLVLGVGATFQFPLLIVLLAWMGLVTSAWLRQYRRHAIVAIFIVAAIITPSFDPMMQTLCAAPLYALYEIAILAAARVEKHRDRPATAAVFALFALLCRPARKPILSAPGFGLRGA